MTVLRPLTRPQQEAARMAGEHIDYAVIEAQTGLSRAQIVAAVDLAELWAGGHADAAVPRAPKPEPIQPPKRRTPRAAAAPPRPSAPSAEPVREPAVERHLPTAAVAGPVADRADQAPADPRPGNSAPGPDRLDVAVTALLSRAAASDDTKVRELADTIARQLELLKELLDREEQTKPLREEIARLEAELSQRRERLAALTAPDPHAASAADRRLFYSSAVRTWALEHRIPVASRGSMSREVVDAYLAAHPDHPGVD